MRRLYLLIPFIISIGCLNGCSFLSDVSHAVGDFSHGVGDAFENEAKRSEGETPTNDLKGNARRSYDYSSSETTSSTETGAGIINSVLCVQEKLYSLGYDPGILDGKMGKKTSTAISNYQKDIGLPVSGKVDNSTASSLGCAQ